MLNLEHCEIRANGIKELAEALRKNNTLVNLNLKNNNLEESEIMIIVNGLLGNRTLTSLDLRSNCYINSEMAKAFRENNTITKVYFWQEWPRRTPLE